MVEATILRAAPVPNNISTSDETRTESEIEIEIIIRCIFAIAFGAILPKIIELDGRGCLLNIDEKETCSVRI